MVISQITSLLNLTVDIANRSPTKDIIAIAGLSCTIYIGDEIFQWLKHQSNYIDNEFDQICMVDKDWRSLYDKPISGVKNPFDDSCYIVALVQALSGSCRFRHWLTFLLQRPLEKYAPQVEDRKCGPIEMLDNFEKQDKLSDRIYGKHWKKMPLIVELLETIKRIGDPRNKTVTIRCLLQEYFSSSVVPYELKNSDEHWFHLFDRIQEELLTVERDNGFGDHSARPFGVKEEDLLKDRRLPYSGLAVMSDGKECISQLEPFPIYEPYRISMPGTLQSINGPLRGTMAVHSFCTVCKTNSLDWVPFHHIKLNIPEGFPLTFRIEDLLNAHCVRKVVRKMCQKCTDTSGNHTETDFVQRSTIGQPPDILVLHVDRYHSPDFFLKKNHKVEFIHSIDLMPYCYTHLRKSSPLKYDRDREEKLSKKLLQWSFLGVDKDLLRIANEAEKKQDPNKISSELKKKFEEIEENLDEQEECATKKLVSIGKQVTSEELTSGEDQPSTSQTLSIDEQPTPSKEVKSVLKTDVKKPGLDAILSATRRMDSSDAADDEFSGQSSKSAIDSSSGIEAGSLATSTSEVEVKKSAILKKPGTPKKHLKKSKVMNTSDEETAWSPKQRPRNKSITPKSKSKSMDYEKTGIKQGKEELDPKFMNSPERQRQEDRLGYTLRSVIAHKGSRSRQGGRYVTYRVHKSGSYYETCNDSVTELGRHNFSDCNPSVFVYERYYPHTRKYPIKITCRDGK